MNKRGVGWWALGGAVLVHLLALYLPGSPDPSGPALIPHLDKIAHVALFALPAFLVRRLTAAWWPVVVLAAHAPISELVQHFWIPYRGGDPLDLLADGVGIGLGLWLAALVSSRAGTAAVDEQSIRAEVLPPT